jgi:hypothetical protein
VSANPRYAYLLDATADETLVGVVIDREGTELARAEGHTESEIQAKLRNGVGFNQWVPDPANNPAIKRAWARRDRRGRGHEVEPDVEVERLHDPRPRMPTAETVAELQARRAEQHLCHFCQHAPMCEMVAVTTRLAALRPIVSGCQGFDPPPPQTVHDLAEDLDALARDGTGEPPDGPGR